MLKVKVDKLLSICFFVLWCFMVIDGLLPQIEMSIFNGFIPLYTSTVKILFIVVGTFTLFLRKQVKVPKEILVWWLLLVAYILLQMIILSLRFGYSYIYIIFSYNAYYYSLLIFPLFYAFSGIISEKIFYRFLVFISIPLVILGLAQYFCNNPIIPVKSVDNYFQVQSWNFYGRVRSFSLFSSALSFGHFLAFMISLIISTLVLQKYRSRLVIFLVFLLILLAGFTTLTRAIYLEIILTLVMALFINFSHPSKLLLSLITIINGLFGFLFAYGIAPIVNYIGASFKIFSTESLIMRYNEWITCIGIWLNRNIMTAFFGTGLIQNDRFALSQNLIIDNNFIAVGVHIGLIGLIIYFGFFWSIWRQLVKNLTCSSSIFTVAVISFFSTWLFTGVFGITWGIYPIVASLSIVIKYDFTAK